MMSDNKVDENLKKALKIYDMLRGINGETKRNQVAISKEFNIPQPDVSRVSTTFGEYRYGNELPIKKGIVCGEEFDFLSEYDIDVSDYTPREYYGIEK